MYTLGFNTLLREAGLRPETVKLVRHQDTSRDVVNSPYQLWRAGDGRFEVYQSLQTRKQDRADVFDGATHIAAFVVSGRDTLFVGVFALNGKTDAPTGTICPVRECPVEDHVLYQMTKTDILEAYEGKVVIAWGASNISWCQWAGRQNKPVIEIRRTVSDPPFPGFLGFREAIADLDNLPPSWRVALESVSGVYLLVCRECGMQYVGSAYGERGFLGRWENYQRTGHGGNEGMRPHPHTDYLVSIIVVAPSTASLEDVVALESRWKDALQTRRFGLNLN